MKNLKALLVILFIGGSSTAFSQYYYYNDNYYDNDFIFEIGANVGMMACITDVGGANSDTKKYFNEWNKKNLAYGAYVGMMYQDFIGLRLQATFGKIQANDWDIKVSPPDVSGKTPSEQSKLMEKTGNLLSKKYRNMNFHSNIAEIALIAEFHPMRLHYYEDGPPALSPYVTAGIGYYHFKPTADYNGVNVDLRSLSLEGQGFPEYPDMAKYSTTQVNVPIGIGVRYEVSEKVNVRLEFMHRILFTDYLDDAGSRKWVNPNVFDNNLSEVQAAYAKVLYNPAIPVPQKYWIGNYSFPPARRANPDDNDAYLTFSLRVGVTIGRRQR